MHSETEAKIREEVASWKLSQLHENCMPVSTYHKDLLLAALDASRVDRADLKRIFDFSLKGVAEALGCEPDPGTVAQHVKQLLKRVSDAERLAAEHREKAWMYDELCK